MKEELLNQKETFDKYVGMRNYDLSAFSFSNLYLWKDFFTFDFRLIQGALCIFAKNEVGVFMYLPPLSSTFNGSLLEECFAVMDEDNDGSGVTRIENVCEDQVHIFEDLGFQTRPKAEEYCYLREDIVGLKGSRYKSKRHDKNLFLANNKAQFIPFESFMKDECLSLYDIWAEDRSAKHVGEDIYLHMLKENRVAQQIAFENSCELGLYGRVVVIGKQVIAYTFGYSVNPEMFCVLFEIVNPEFSGLASYIFSELCADTKIKKYSFINTMDDLFLDNLRQAKESFCPVRKASSFIATRKT